MTSNPLQIERIAIFEQLSRLSQANSDVGHRQVILMSAQTVSAWEFIGDYVNRQKIANSAPAVTALNTMPVVTPKHSQLENALSNTNSAITNINIKLCRPDKPNTLLGFDCENAIIDCSQGFYPDALTAIAGTIRPGGFLFIVCPTIKRWPNTADDFASKRTAHGFLQPASSPNTINRFINTSLKNQAVCINIVNEHIEISLGQGKSLVATTASNLIEANKLNESKTTDKLLTTKPLVLKQLTDQQQQILKDINIQTHISRSIGGTKNGNEPVFHIIQADRGRGKSHLLGHLINLLISKATTIDCSIDAIKDNGINYYITAPNKTAIQSAIQVTNIGHDIQFIAPENVKNHVKATDILLVDEAASLPLPQLMSWACHFKTIVFATTTHGYEGTGKGFQIRFINYLKTLSSNIHQHYLTTPIRYADNDPLEQVMFESFALNCEPKGISNQFSPQQTEHAQCRQVSQQELADNPALLEELFALLVQAHYQTRPSDIRDLLDADGMAIYCAFITANNQLYLASACLVCFEGGLDHTERALIDSINKGVRRPQGHLIPQVLTLHMNQKSALLLTSARIIRIATLANVQNKNLASKLLSFITTKLTQQNIDYLGSSYADTNDVNSFWNKNNFKAIRSGKKLDKASGTFSTLVIKGLSEQGKAVEKSSVEFFNNQKNIHANFKTLSDDEKQLIQTFITATGSYEAIKDILSRCNNWPSFYLHMPFPKKAKQDFRDQVTSWTQL
jgi:tRNA(Met) cytidine acetyltransferase